MRATSRIDVLALCVSKGAGFRRGRQVAQFIFEWELAVRGMRRPITAEEFADWWKDGNATAYRRLHEFRETFPELGDRGMPHDLMRPLVERLATGEDVEGVDVALVVPA